MSKLTRVSQAKSASGHVADQRPACLSCRLDVNRIAGPKRSAAQVVGLNLAELEAAFSSRLMSEQCDTAIGE